MVISVSGQCLVLKLFTVVNRQVFWLPVHPTRQPSHSHEANSGMVGFRPRLQRRDRSRIPRDSLLSLAAPETTIILTVS